MELDNNDEDDNLGRNPLINNNNDNNNLQNIINNNNNNEEFNNFISEYSKFTLSFIIIFLINLIIWITSFHYNLEKYKFVFEIDPILEHYQYYRFISRYFVHFGICHLLLELYITLFICNYFENVFGTLMSISFIFLSIVIDSMIHLGLFSLLSYISNYFQIIVNMPNYEGGLTPVLFTLSTFFYLFDYDYLNEYNIFLFVPGNGKYFSFIMLIILFFFTPNRTFLGNLSGIIGAYLIGKIFLCILPRIRWIMEFEGVFNLNKKSCFYRCVTNKNIVMKKVLNKIEPNSVKDVNTDIMKVEENGRNNNQNNNNENNNEDHQSVIEMSSLPNNNNDNINNQNN